MIVCVHKARDVCACACAACANKCVCRCVKGNANQIAFSVLPCCRPVVFFVSVLAVDASDVDRVLPALLASLRCFMVGRKYVVRKDKGRLSILGLLTQECLVHRCSFLFVFYFFACVSTHCCCSALVTVAAPEQLFVAHSSLCSSSRCRPLSISCPVHYW